MVYVISEKGNALMPTTPAKARVLLKGGRAKCVRRTPFTIKLLYETTEYTQELTHGIDTGSAAMGSAVVDNKGNVAYISEIELRNDITEKMKQRAKNRRNRRSRKTRYRQTRWENRRNSKRKERFTPTMTSKIESHIREINYVQSILPVTGVILETTTFDAHALKNPDVLENKELYQRGINYGYANTRAYVLNRDGYMCQICKGKSQDKHLQTHHIIYRSNGGSDEADNLACLCRSCHDGVHEGRVELKLKGKTKGQLSHATQMNSIRRQLLRRVDCEETFGFVTKEHRQLQGLAKTHYTDAAVIASRGGDIQFKVNQLLLKKCISDGDSQQTKGVRSEQRIPTGKIQGYRKFDKVRYRGEEYFIKGRMTSGYAILMDIHGNKAELKPIPKFSRLRRLSVRKSWIIQAKTIQSIV